MAGKARGDGDADPVIAGLKQVVTQLTNLQMEPTAGQHQQILQQLPQAIIGYIQQQQQKKAAQAAQAQQMMAQQAAGGGPQSPPQPGGMPRGVPGGPPSQGMPGLGMPNPDELRRVLSQGAAA